MPFTYVNGILVSAFLTDGGTRREFKAWHLGFCRYLTGFTGFAHPSPLPGFSKEVACFQWDTETVPLQLSDFAGDSSQIRDAIGVRGGLVRFASPLAFSRIPEPLGPAFGVEAAHVIIVRRRPDIICNPDRVFWEISD